MSFYNLSNVANVVFRLTFFDSQELEPDVGGDWKAHKNDGWALLPMVVAKPCQTVKQSNSQTVKQSNSQTACVQTNCSIRRASCLELSAGWRTPIWQLLAASD